jgi:hypothetical protein
MDSYDGHLSWSIAYKWEFMSLRCVLDDEKEARK